MFELLFIDPHDDRWSPVAPRHLRFEVRGLRPRGRPHGNTDSEEALRELLFVHRRELVRLLLLAAGSHPAWSGSDTSLAAFPVTGVSVRSWRRRARRVLHLVALDRASLPAGAPVRDLLRRPARHWPEVKVLTAAALEHGAGLWGELCHAHALLGSGETRAAETRLRALLGQDPPPRVRWRAYEGLAAVHDAAGRPLLAMGAMEEAAEDPACGVGPLVWGLYLALRVGDRRRCRRAAARLDLLVRPDEPAFLAVLARLRARAHGEDVDLPLPRPGSIDGGGCGLAARGRSSAERLLRALG